MLKAAETTNGIRDLFSLVVFRPSHDRLDAPPRLVQARHACGFNLLPKGLHPSVFFVK